MEKNKTKAGIYLNEIVLENNIGVNILWLGNSQEEPLWKKYLPTK